MMESLFNEIGKSKRNDFEGCMYKNFLSRYKWEKYKSINLSA